MRPSAEFGLRCATVAVVGLSYLALATTSLFGPQLIFVPIAGCASMPIGESLDRRFKAYRFVTNFIIYLYIVLFAIVSVRYSFLDAVLSLVMFIQVYLLVHSKQTRHYAYIVLMSFFLLWAAVTESPRPDIAFVLFSFVLAVGWALTRLEMFRAEVAVLESGLPVAKARLQARGAGAVRHPRTGPMKFSLAMVLLTAATAAMGSGIFLFGPRTEAGVFGASTPRIRPTTGVSSEISLLTSGALQKDSSPVMRVQFPSEPNGQFRGPMLWRVTALDAYTGDGWLHRGVTTRPGAAAREEDQLRFASDWRLASREGLDRPSDAGWPLVHQEIYLDRQPDTAVPALQMLKTILAKEHPEDFVFRWDLAGDFSAVMSTRTETGIFLDAWSELILPTPAELRRSQSDYESAMSSDDFLNLTYQNLLPETLALVRRVTANAPTVYDKVTALTAYLSGPEYVYTTLIPRLPSRNPMDAFILDEKQGHCELYASALTLMVRSLGVPARVVTGYRGGVWSPNDRSYTITNDMAHLWTEVYFPGQGWVSFDPSPVGDEELAIIDRLSHQLSLRLLRLRMFWLRYVVGYRPEDNQMVLENVSAQFFRAAGSALENVGQRRPDAARSPLRRNVLTVVGAGAVILSVAYLGWRRAMRNTPVQVANLTPDQQRAVRLRTGIVRAFRRWGIAGEGKTAEELTQEISALGLNDPAAARTIIDAYNFSRFGQRPMSAESYAAWRRRLREVKPHPLDKKTV